ncbi:MAG: hypothetical protein ACI4QU_04700 [Christensenellales bacterium]
MFGRRLETDVKRLAAGEIQIGLGGFDGDSVKSYNFFGWDNVKKYHFLE